MFEPPRFSDQILCVLPWTPANHCQCTKKNSETIILYEYHSFRISKWLIFLTLVVVLVLCTVMTNIGIIWNNKPLSKKILFLNIGQSKKWLAFFDWHKSAVKKWNESRYNFPVGLKYFKMPETFFTEL